VRFELTAFTFAGRRSDPLIYKEMLVIPVGFEPTVVWVRASCFDSAKLRDRSPRFHLHASWRMTFLLSTVSTHEPCGWDTGGIRTRTF
jgi:hypothetical protein